MLIQVSKGLRFVGGETAALSRVIEYFWNEAREALLLYFYKCLFFHC